MRLLSPFKVYRNDKGKLALLVIPLFLGVLLLYTLQMVIASYYHVQFRAFVETRKYYTSIQARGNLIQDETLQTIRQHSDVEKVVPCVLGYTEIDGAISTVGVRIYLLYRDDLQELIERMDLTVSEGRLPEPGEPEIVLHEDVLRNKGLNIGGVIGSDALREEKLLGEYRIVGALRGTALAGFAPLETWKQNTGVSAPERYGVVIYPEPGKLDALNRYLDYLPLTGTDLSSYSNSTSELARSSESVYLLLHTIYLAVLLILSVCLGFLTYLFYRGRLKEFAILHVLGYSKQTLILRNVAEVVVLNALTAAAGIAGSILIGAALNAAVFRAMGTPLLLLDGKTLLLSLCMPMLCIAAQILSIGLSFRDMDVVGILEIESGGAL